MHHFHTKLPYQKAMLRQIEWVLPVTTLFFWKFCFSLRTWFDVPTTQMHIFTLFVSAAVLFDGAFSLWVSLT